MLEKSLETLFRRYRTRGDAKALGQVFDRTARELLAVAAHLGHGPAEAEDVVQETFLAALSAAKRWDEKRPLMPWLVGILTREARYHRRKAARSVEPDRLAPRVAAAPTDAAEREELATAIAEALRRVPPNYREVLVGHLADGLAPREIAERLGRAPGTVRVQLHRGLEHLRKALPPSFALGVAATAIPGRGLAAVRAEVLAGAPLKIGVSTATIPLRALALAGAAAGVLGLTWMQLGSGAGLAQGPEIELLLADAPDGNVRIDRASDGLRPASPVDRNAGAPAAEEVAGERARRTAVELPEFLTRTEPEPPRARESWSVEGRLIYRGPFDAARARVSLTVDGQPLGATTPDGRGNFQLDFSSYAGNLPADPELFRLRVDHPDFAVAVEEIAPRDFGSGPTYREVRSVKLRAPAGFFEGDVDIPSGVAHVALLPLTKGRGSERLVLEPSADEVSTLGHYRLRAPEPGDYLVVATQSERPPAWCHVTLDKRATDTVLCAPLSITPGCTVIGELRLPPGVTVDGAQIVSRPADVERVLDLRGEATFVSRDGQTVETLPWRGLLWNGERFLRDVLSCPVDEHGRYELRGLAEDLHVLTVVQVPGFEGERFARTETWVPTAPQNLVPEISLLRVAVTKDGEPAPHAPLKASDGQRIYSAATDSSGEGELVVMAARPLRLESSSAAGHAQHFVQSAVASRWVRVSLELGDAPLVPGKLVGATAPTTGDANSASPRTDGPAPPENGLVLLLEGEGPELLHVRWRPSSGGEWQETRVVPETWDMGEDAELTVYMLPDTGPVRDVTATSEGRRWRSEVLVVEADYRIFQLVVD